MRRPPRAERAGSTHITPAVLHRLPLPPVDSEQGKEGRGCVLVVGGSDQIPGAVILAATAALRAGAGKLQIATGRRVAPLGRRGGPGSARDRPFPRAHRRAGARAPARPFAAKPARATRCWSAPG